MNISGLKDEFTHNLYTLYNKNIYKNVMVDKVLTQPLKLFTCGDANAKHKAKKKCPAQVFNMILA